MKATYEGLSYIKVVWALTCTNLLITFLILYVELLKHTIACLVFHQLLVSTYNFVFLNLATRQYLVYGYKAWS